MADCPCLTGCPFFNDMMTNMPIAADQIKKHLCKGDNSDCARYMIFSTLGKGKVPKDLFPRQTDRAKQIIEAG